MIRYFAAFIVLAAMSGCTMFQQQPIGAARISNEKPRAVPSEIANLPVGGVVDICDTRSNSVFTTRGTVLQAGETGIVLGNCTQFGETIVNHVPSVPYFSRLFKVSGVGVRAIPVLWVPIREIEKVSLHEPPPHNFVAPQLGLNLSDQMTFERVGVDFDFNTRKLKN